MNITNLPTVSAAETDYIIAVDGGITKQCLVSTLKTSNDSGQTADGIDIQGAETELLPSLKNEVYIYLDGGSDEITLPANDLISIGTVYIVSNTSTTDPLIINLDGVTCATISTGVSSIPASTADNGYEIAYFMKTESTVYFAWGSIS